MLRSSLRLSRRDVAYGRRHQHTEAPRRIPRKSTHVTPPKVLEIQEKFSDPLTMSILGPPGNHHAVARTSRRVGNLAEAYEVIRAIEGRFGPLREYRFQKDMNCPKTSTTSLRLFFRDPIPAGVLEEELKVKVKTLPRNVPPEGVGLADLVDLLEPHSQEPTIREFEEPTEDASKESSRDIVISVGPPLASHGVNMHTNMKKYPPLLAQDLLAWGGFAPMQPLEPGAAITPDVSQPVMRAAMERWMKLSEGKVKAGLRMPVVLISTPTKKEPTPSAPIEDVAPTPMPPPPPAPSVIEGLVNAEGVMPWEYMASIEPIEPLASSPSPVVQEVREPAPVLPVHSATKKQRRAETTVTDTDPVARKQTKADLKVIQRLMSLARDSDQQTDAKQAASKSGGKKTKKRAPTKKATSQATRPTPEEKKEDMVQPQPTTVVSKLKKSLFGSWL